MAKYSRFDERNKKKTKDKYRSEKKGKSKPDESGRNNTINNADLRQLEKMSVT